MPEDQIPSISALFTENGDTPNRGTCEPEMPEIEEEEFSTPHPVWTELVTVLVTLPPTMRLGHLVQKLEYVQKITTSSALPKLSAFGEDVGALLGLAREADERLLKENHFSNDVMREI